MSQVTPLDCRVIGAGDGSVLVYCTPCREALPKVPHRATLNAVLTAWTRHADRTHPPEDRPDPWTDPDGAALAEPPPF